MLAPANVLTEWIAKQKLRRSRVVPLGAAWFGDALADYTIYRLGYFALNTVLAMCLHIVEFYLLTHIFDHDLLREVLLIRLGSFAVSAAWWGALEVMRKRIRLLQGKANRVELALELGRWQMLGVGLMLLFFAIALYYGYLAASPATQTGLSELYCAAIFLTLGMRFWVETKKAGVYAVIRIWRPLWSIILIPVIGLILMVLFWWWFGIYTIIITLVFGRAIGAWLSLYFTQRSSKQLQYPDAVLPSVKQFTVFLKTLLSWELFAAAFAFAVIDISGILVGLLSLTHQASIFSDSAFILFYFVNPLLKAGTDWAMLFYFDFKKHQAGVLEPFLASFTKRFLFITPLIGIFFWCLAIIFTASYFEETIYLISLVFLILFVLRAGIAFLQMIAFCQERYISVMLCGTCILLAVVGMGWTTSNGAALMILLAGLLASIAIIIVPGLFISTAKPAYALLNAHAWYACLKNEKQPVQLWRFQLTPDITSYQKRTLLKLLLPKAIYQRSAWFWLDQETVLGFSVQQNLSDVFEKMIVRQAGLIQAYQFSSVTENGIAALREVKADNLLASGIVSTVEEKLNREQLLQLFQQRFPEGWCHRGRRIWMHTGFNHMTCKKNYYQTFLYRVTHVLRSPGDCSDDQESSISVAFPKRGAPLIFVIPYSYENKNVAAQWKKSIYVWNIGQFAS